MKLFLLLLTATLSSYCCFSQVGINTSNPKALLHIDGAGDNPTSGTISESAQKNDVVITSSGSIGIGTIDPAAYSSLEIASDKGLRLPQLTNSQISELDSATDADENKNGLTVFNTETNCINFWVDTEWKKICGN